MKLKIRQNATTVILIVSLLVSGLLLPSLARADIFNVYNDAGIPRQSEIFTYPDGASFETLSDEESPERVQYFETVTCPEEGWAGWGVFFRDEGEPYTVDLSNYAEGQLKFFVRTPIDLKVEIQEVGPNGPLRTEYISDHGWNEQNEWQEISIPIEDFEADLDQIYASFMIAAEEPATFHVDYVRWSVPIGEYEPSIVAVDGRQLLMDGDVFKVKGVAAELTPVGEYGPWYDWSQHPENYNIDIPLMSDMGANTIKTYLQRPTQSAALNALYEEGIYVVMGFCVDVVYGEGEIVDFENEVVRENIIRCFLDMVGHWKDHPAILMWSLGNEVNTILEANDIWPGHWYSLVEECAQAAHQLEGDNYHPVTTANAEQEGEWDIGDPDKNADDESLAHLDLWSLQLYQGESFGDTFGDYEASSNKPLLMSEFGCDAYDGRNDEENERMQAEYLESQWSHIRENLSSINPDNVCVGGIVFSWRDGWYKSNFGLESYFVHNTDPDWFSIYYEDQNMNEEWWGIVAISEDPEERILREGYDTISAIWQAPFIDITYPQEGQITPTLTPTITWDTDNIAPDEELRIIISHQYVCKNYAANFNFKDILLEIMDIFDVQPAYAESMYISLWVEDLNIEVENTGSYVVPEDILSVNVRYRLEISKETDLQASDTVNFRARERRLRRRRPMIRARRLELD